MAVYSVGLTGKRRVGASSLQRGIGDWGEAKLIYTLPEGIFNGSRYPLFSVNLTNLGVKWGDRLVITAEGNKTPGNAGTRTPYMYVHGSPWAWIGRMLITETITTTTKTWTVNLPATPPLTGAKTPADSANFAIYPIPGEGTGAVDLWSAKVYHYPFVPPPPPSKAAAEEIVTLTTEKATLETELEAKAATLTTLKEQLAIIPTPEQAKQIAELKTGIALLQKRLVEVNGEIASLKTELAARGVVSGLGALPRRYIHRR